MKSCKNLWSREPRREAGRARADNPSLCAEVRASGGREAGDGLVPPELGRGAHDHRPASPPGEGVGGGESDSDHSDRETRRAGEPAVQQQHGVLWRREPGCFCTTRAESSSREHHAYQHHAGEQLRGAQGCVWEDTRNILFCFVTVDFVLLFGIGADGHGQATKQTRLSG